MAVVAKGSNKPGSMPLVVGNINGSWGFVAKRAWSLIVYSCFYVQPQLPIITVKGTGNRNPSPRLII